MAERPVLYADLLESEALWGLSCKEIFQVLFYQHELLTDIMQYLEPTNSETTQDLSDALVEFRGDRRGVMYDHSGEEPDKFKQDVQSAIGRIEEYLKPKQMHEPI